MKDSFDFSVEKTLPRHLGRAGTIKTPHGSIKTPAFVTVGTKATVKALTPLQLEEIGVQVVLGNTYHLYLEPGPDCIEKAFGFGRFMGWSGPTITDSGGFQVFSLGAAYGRKLSKFSTAEPREAAISGEEVLEPAGALATIDDDGVTFRSVINGSTHRFTPERSIEIQKKIGADIVFAFDECTSPEAPVGYQRQAMERTHRWAKRSLSRHYEFQRADPLHPQALFGIVQGGRFEELRKESARTIGAMAFDGFGIGGSFQKEDVDAAVGWVNTILPPEKPRHLLGIGEPLDLFGAVENGCDLFDCVAPTRLARNGALYTRYGRINILNARFVADFSKVDDACVCYTCRTFSRAYLSHLFRSNELLANTLASIHNLFFITALVKEMRQAILEKTFSKLKENFFEKYQK